MAMRALDCQSVRQRHSLSRHRQASPGEKKAIRLLHALAIVLIAASAGAAGLAQTASTPGKKTEAKFAGGFRPDACRWPRAARQAQLSGCCQMDLDIDAEGHMIRGEGVCSDPIFLEPTLRCLAAQEFIPARRNGQTIADQHHMEYEWRATTPPGQDLCNKLKTS